MKNLIVVFDSTNNYYKWNRYGVLLTETTDYVYLDIGNVLYYSDSIKITDNNYNLKLELVDPLTVSVLTSLVECADIYKDGGGTYSCTFSGLLSETYTLKYSVKEDILGRQYRNAITVYTPDYSPTLHYARVGTDCFTITVHPNQSSWDSAMQTIFNKNAYFDCGNNAFVADSTSSRVGTFTTSGNTWTYTIRYVELLKVRNYLKGVCTDNTLRGGGFDCYQGTWTGVITDGGFGSNTVANKYWTVDNSVIYFSPPAYEYTTIDGQHGYAAHQTAWGTGIWHFPSWVHGSEIMHGLTYGTVNYTPTVILSLTNDYPSDGWISPYYYKKFCSPGLKYTFEDKDLHEGVKYDLVCNTETNISPGTVAVASISFVLKELRGLTVGDELQYNNIPIVIKQELTSFRGRYIVKSIVKGEDNYTVTAYEQLCKFDINVKDWLNTLTYPMTVMSLLTLLCNYCGVNLNPALTSFINSDMYINNHFGNEQIITGRQVLEYIAQVAAGYICGNHRLSYVSSEWGTVTVETFGTSTTNISKADYTNLFYEDYECQAIDKVYVSNDENTPGMSVGTGSNVLSIIKNPLLYFDDASEIQSAVLNIYNEVSTHSAYTPMKINALWRLLNTGDCVRVDVGDGTTHIYKTACILSESITPSGYTYESTGEETRTS